MANTDLKTDTAWVLFGDTLDESDPYQIISYAERASFAAENELWKVCYAAALIVGRFTAQTAELAGRLGKSIPTIEFYAKAWRVREYVSGSSVPCSLGLGGYAGSDLICRNLTVTHYGRLHSKVFVSLRLENEMKYEAIMPPSDALSWLAEAVEPISSEARRLSPEALLMLMGDSPDTTQWDEAWGSLSDRLLDFVLRFGEYMPDGLRTQLNALIKEYRIEKKTKS